MSGLPFWLSRDPLQEKGGENLYGFVGNNPINAFDPLGLWAYTAGPVQLTGGETDVYPLPKSSDGVLGVTIWPDRPKINCDDGTNLTIELSLEWHYLSPAAISAHAKDLWDNPINLRPIAVSRLAKVQELQHVNDGRVWLSDEVPKVLVANPGLCCSDLKKKLRASYTAWVKERGEYWDGTGKFMAPKRHAIDPDGELTFPFLQ